MRRTAYGCWISPLTRFTGPHCRGPSPGADRFSGPHPRQRHSTAKQGPSSPPRARARARTPSTHHLSCCTVFRPRRQRGPDPAGPGAQARHAGGRRAPAALATRRIHTVANSAWRLTPLATAAFVQRRKAAKDTGHGQTRPFQAEKTQSLRSIPGQADESSRRAAVVSCLLLGSAQTRVDRDQPPEVVAPASGILPVGQPCHIARPGTPEFRRQGVNTGGNP